MPLMRRISAALKMRGAWPKLLAAPLGLALMAMAACNGTALVTLTATPSSDTFLAYRVGLVSAQLQTSSGSTSLKVLPAGTTVDFVKLLDLSEVLGVPTAAKGTYTSAVITLDYSAAQIVFDDGSVNGVALTPVTASGQAAGQISVTVNLDANAPFRITAKNTSLLALNFNLAASNVVDSGALTVTVTPMIAASTTPIDSKPVRIRGPLVSANASGLFFTSGVMPFGGTVSGFGDLSIATSDTTTYEVNGTEAVGVAGLTLLSGAGQGALSVAFGTLTTSATIAAATSTAASSTGASAVAFTAQQVLAGSSVQGAVFDRISGIVSARSGNTLSVEDATLIATDGTNTFIPGTSIVNIGANTLVTVLGQSPASINSPLQISVGSAIAAFGTATSGGSGNIVLDASAGRVRLDQTTAWGVVGTQGTAGLSLNLTSLGGRSIPVYDFVGSGADPARYSVATGALDLANAIVGAPVIVSGFPNSFGVASPNFTATTLLDPTTIQAELVVDWGAGTAAPFVSFNSSGIDLDVQNSGIGPRHQIQIGSQIIDIVGLSSDPLIAPTSAATAVYAIGHAASSTIQSFNSYTDFITQLQTELNGVTLATGITAVGQYTASTFAFSAMSITLFLNN
jgi:hypothetical protein